MTQPNHERSSDRSQSSLQQGTPQDAGRPKVLLVGGRPSGALRQPDLRRGKKDMSPWMQQFVPMIEDHLTRMKAIEHYGSSQ